MTWGTGSFHKRCVANRIEQPFVRAAVSIMALHARVLARGNTLVGGEEFFGAGGMAFAAEFGYPGLGHAFFIGSMGHVTFHTVLNRRFMGNSLTPVLGHFLVTGQAEHGLAFFQDVIMGRAVGSMTAGTFSGNCRLVRSAGSGNLTTDIFMAVKTDFS